MTRLRVFPLFLALQACHGEDLILGGLRHDTYTGDVPLVPVSAPCASSVTRLASIPDLDPRFLRSDALNLYAVSSSKNEASIWKIPKLGQPIAIVPSVPPIGGIDIVVDKWADDSTIFYTSNAAVRSIQSNGDNYFTSAIGRENIGPILVHGGSVYWAETQRDPSGALQGVVSSVDLQGGTIQTIAITAAEHVPRRLVATGHMLAWSDDAGEIVSIPLYPFAPQTLAASDAGALLATPDGLFFAVQDAIVRQDEDGGIRRVAVKGRSPGLAADDISVYFFDDDHLAKTPLWFGASAVPIADTSPSDALAVDDKCVYFVDGDTGAIMMVHK